jgi:hypothetical protein
LAVQGNSSPVHHLHSTGLTVLVISAACVWHEARKRVGKPDSQGLGGREKTGQAEKRR